MIVRPEAAGGLEAVYRVNEVAFGQPAEAGWVDGALPSEEV